MNRVHAQMRKIQAPPLVVQRRIWQACHTWFARFGSSGTGTTFSAPEIDRLVLAMLAVVTDELGAGFWRQMELRAEPSSAVPERPANAPKDAVFAFMGDDQRREAEAALWFAQRHAIPSVALVLQAYAAQRAAARRAPTVKECVAGRLAERLADGTAFDLWRSYRSRLNPFVERFGDQRPGEISGEAIAEFATQSGNPAAVQYRARTASTFFEWAFRRQYVVDNPVPDSLRLPRRERRPLLVFTPRQARCILRETRHTDQIGFWALTFFGGLRTSEIQRLDRHPAPWSLVHFHSGELEIPGNASDEIDRTMRMLPVLQTWLKWMRSRAAPFFPTNFWQRKFPRAWKYAFRKFPDGRTSRTGYRKPPFPKQIIGVPRGTHITYRLALPGTTIEEVALETGDRVKLTRPHHDPTMTPRRARDFFALTPERL